MCPVFSMNNRNMVLKAHFKTAILNRVVFRNYNKVLETVLKETSNLIRT
jgi:hypothetical protein